jgi:hypothetical protein
MKTNPFHQTVIVTGGATGISQRLSVWRRKVSACAGRSGHDFRVREVNVWRAMLAQLASGSKCF